MRLHPDAFITGEISEPQAHHAIERYGSAEVVEHVADQLGLVHEFIDLDNPA